MDTLFHFIFPIMAALAAKVHTKHEVRTIITAAFLAVLLDLDHFIGLERATFHNVFITILIPLILLYLSYVFKMKKNTKGFFLLLLIFLSSHMFMDLFSAPPLGNGIGIETGTGVALFYPLSTTYYAINFNIRIPLQSSSQGMIEGYLISSLGFGILMYFMIIVIPCLFLDDILDISEKSHERFLKAAKTFFRRLAKD